MLFGNRRPQSLAARRRGGFRPRIQSLEERQLMSIDLGGVLPPGQPNIATAPFGVDLAGQQTAGAAGFSVANVGDVNGDGFDDFVIGAPTGINVNGQIQPGNGTNSRAYLVFGSLTVNAGNIDWLTLDKLGERVGDLGQLGNASQTNPISGSVGNAYAGVTFLTSVSTTSQLGASVTALGDVNGDGFADFLIGAPGANDLNNLNPGTGRAYLVYGSASLGTLATPTVDLDNVAASPGVAVTTFGSTLANSRVGRSAASLGNFFASNSTSPDIAIAAPNASVAGLSFNGAVYTIPGPLLATPSVAPINLNAIGNGLGGAIFAGSANNESIGLSVAGAGNVDGQLTGANIGIDDLLIGSPVANGNAGEAFLIYGGNALPGAARVVNGLNVILTNRIGVGTGSTDILGANFQGASGSRTGFSVAGIGDYNGNGFADIAIGSPSASSNAGQADIFYGQPASGTTLVGTIPVFSKPVGVPSLTLVGAPNAMAGYSLSLAGKINPASTGNDFMVGSPGLNGNQGGVYYIPANPFFVEGTQQLLSAEGSPLAATLIQITNTPNGAPSFLGSSVSGRLVARSQTKTADGDTIPDIILGAATYNVTPSGRTGAGGAFVIEGAFLPFNTPSDNRIQTDIAVGSAPVGLPPFGTFIVNATSPASLDIYVLSNNTISPPFIPFTDIDTTTIAVNGVPYPNATIRLDTVDRNNDGIPDAIITITPRSRLNLNSTITTFTLTGRTLSSAPNSNVGFLGTAQILVSGGVNPNPPTVGAGGTGVLVGTIPQTSFTPQFGADHYVPPASVLSRLNYKAIPRAVAYQQYLPGRGWALRLQNFAHPKNLSRVPSGTQNSLAGPLPLTLNKNVFTRSKYKKAESIEFTHKTPVIPTNRQTERFLAKGRKHPRS
ncbi:FG-GAP repeat protein [Singulisphaera acidiphila DSM 18658]|uniref:FG-GAP repeat protein n=2 Tax=Singulisphaera acidiphila TaxID=466153 RepID=L0DJE5_SINAD|nr:FG-GAP repeat protein [Singulisphaera acidiphila DSM 18658]